MTTNYTPPYVQSEIFAIKVFSPEEWHSRIPFDNNAYPRNLISIVDSCSLRLTLILLGRDEVKRGVLAARKQLIKDLRTSKSVYIAATKNVTSESYAIASGTEYLPSFYHFLVQVKSFLDVYAKLMGKLIDPKLNWSFGKKAKVDGIHVSGATIINWMRNSAPKDFTNAEDLASLVELHSNEWISEVVGMRDRITHESEIPGLTHTCVKLQKNSRLYDINAIHPPKLKDGKLLINLVDEVVSKLSEFVIESLIKLPNVDLSMESLQRFRMPIKY